MWKLSGTKKKCLKENFATNEVNRLHDQVLKEHHKNTELVWHHQTQNFNFNLFFLRFSQIKHLVRTQIFLWIKSGFMRFEKKNHFLLSYLHFTQHFNFWLALPIVGFRGIYWYQWKTINKFSVLDEYLNLLCIPHWKQTRFTFRESAMLYGF